MTQDVKPQPVKLEGAQAPPGMWGEPKYFAMVGAGATPGPQPPGNVPAERLMATPSN